MTKSSEGLEMLTEEHEIQCAICQVLDAHKILYFAVPNGGKRSITTACRLKKEGVKSGVSDLVLLLPNAVTVFVEVKTAKNRQQDTQKTFQSNVEKLGFKYLIWRSVDDAVKFIKEVK